MSGIEATIPVPASVDQVVVHGDDCFDGHTAAWLINRKWPEAQIHYAVYGEPVEWLIESGAPQSVLLIADFSYPRDITCRLAETWGTVIVIDHHKTAAAHLTDLPANVRVAFDMLRSGAGMVADWLGFRTETQLGLVDYVEDRDLWKFELPDSRSIAAAIGAHPNTFDNSSYLDSFIRTNRATLAESGRMVRRRDQVIIDELVAVARVATIGGYRVPVSPSPYALGSSVAGHLAEGHPFGAYYRDMPDCRAFGLRSTSSGVDVSTVAEQYGGGGHRNASGFKVEWGHPLAPRWEM